MTVTRDAVIRIRTERVGGSGGGFEARAFAAESRAAREAAQEIERTNKGLRESELHFGRFEIQGARALANVGRGALELGRGLALLSTSSEEDTQKIVQQFLAVEAAVSIVKGAASTFKALQQVVGTTASSFIGYTAAVTGAFIAVDYFSESQRKAREEVERFNTAKENGLRLLRQESSLISQRTALENEQSAIDFQLANLPGGGRISSLEQLRSALAKDQSNSVLREEFARGRLGDIDAGKVGGAFRPAAQADLASAEERQATVLRNRIRVEEDLLNARLEELRNQEQAIRSNPFLGSRGAGIGPSTEGQADAAINALRAQAKQIESESAGILRELLEQLRSQAEQVSQARKDLQSLQN